MSPRKKYWISIVAMLLLVGGIWSGISIAQSCEKLVVPTTTPTPTASATASSSPSVSPSASATASASASPTASASPAPTEKCKRGLDPKLGLDLQGGLSIVLTPKNAVKTDALDKAVDIIRQRIDALGVAEPDISRQGNNILVQLPGVKDLEEARKVIGQTAFMTFRQVEAEIPPGSPDYAKAGPPCTQFGSGDIDPTKLIDQQVVFCARQKSASGVDLPPESWPKLVLGKAALVGSDVSGADAEPPSGNPGGSAGWSVGLNLSSAGGKKFETVTGELACQQGAKRQLAIVLDQIVESHPQMAEDVQCKQGIAGGRATITGTFDQKESNGLALVLRYGALPVALEASQTQTVSPTLGRDTLRTGLLAGFIGLGLVLIYVLLFYRILGLVIWVGLFVFSAFVIGVVIILGQTAGFALTLAGIAGIIVSVGIAADSYIVYFERVKDEVHQGRTVRSAVDRAWESARRTIIAADLVTALAALVLYLLAVGSVRGFALMLGIATGLDVFISFLLMHPSVWLLAQTKWFNQAKRMGVKNVVGAEAPAGGGR